MKLKPSYGGVKSILPMKMIAAESYPCHLCGCLSKLAGICWGQVLKATGNPAYADIATNLVTWFQVPNPGTFTGATWQAFIYPAAYFLLVVAFTYFYTGIVFNSSEIAENLQKQGGFIEGVRPGQQTEKYLSRTMNRLILWIARAWCHSCTALYCRICTL